MSILKKVDVGWLFLLCGLVLAVSAITLPAHQDLTNLQSKHTEIKKDLEHLHYRVFQYQQFLDSLQEQDPDLIKRVSELQLNSPMDGSEVVIDFSASMNPLDWIAQRTRQPREVETMPLESSLLTTISSGRSRLILIGAAAIAMFAGFFYSTTTNKSK